MTHRYTIGERWFMWKALRMAGLYGTLWKLLDRIGWQKEANWAFNRSHGWWERGWECSQGM